MPDPRLVSRAQRAATMLERAWDRWRAAYGLAAEPLPPVSSYVGYSIEEPWGRPRVVFGVDAADAEKLATLLQDCAAPQQALDEARTRIPAQGRAADVNGSHGQGSGATHEGSGVPPAGGSANGFHQVETEARPEDPTDPGRVPEGATGGSSVQGDASPDAAAPASSVADVTVIAPDEDLDGRDGQATPDVSDGAQPEQSAGADGEEPGEDASDPQAASDTDDLRADDHGDAGHGVADTMAAELAGWAAGELPGQASARLAAWATVGGTTARSGADEDLRAGGAT
jgi:hypothetical protein